MAMAQGGVKPRASGAQGCARPAFVTSGGVASTLTWGDSWEGQGASLGPLFKVIE
jgi:hypothetical protein